ncbi:DNA repair photolyase [Methanomicrobium sp. W14]|uniref:DUF1848 domain-containing protein n=1 Tax=Methanomicrobium sp. W14 TaxID=2817839 RepID=UPI001AE52E49|nr:DUF1848 domain-containing protein [Methanomicrobium sp. W14]MBP2133847.1 DNA repair photolyase [Methanomicrobium sp. W14]
MDKLRPVIFSAGRATDIPAFYPDWIIERLKEGYLIKVNPFNGKPYRVSFENTRFIVFWTKNPGPILKNLSYFDKTNIGYYFQYTLNDYDREGYEKNVPSLDKRVKTFKKLSEISGSDRVVWRFDPLILSDTITIDTLLERTEYIGDEIFGYTHRMVFSFIDMYRSVELNLKKQGIAGVREFEESEMEEFSEKLSALNRRWNYSISACAEKKDLSKYGIKRSRCIDPELIDRICHTPEMHDYLMKNSGKDRGQRPMCGCIPSVDAGQYNTCVHLCSYCYANRNPLLAMENYRQYLKNPHKESLS